MDPIEIIGQGFGIVAFIIAFFAYQADTSKKLLFIQTVAVVCFCIHYAMIGAATAFVLNAVGVIRNLIFYFNDKKIFSSKLWPYFLAFIMLILGVMTYQGWYSVLFIIGLSVNTVCMSLPTSQGIRKSLLFTCPPVLVYNIIVVSVGGIINEILSIISATVGIIRYRKENRAAEK